MLFPKIFKQTRLQSDHANVQKQPELFYYLKSIDYHPHIEHEKHFMWDATNTKPKHRYVHTTTVTLSTEYTYACFTTFLKWFSIC